MWLHYGFGMACTFNRDYHTVGSFREDLEGWGGEDVDLYEKYVKSNIRVSPNKRHNNITLFICLLEKIFKTKTFLM